MLRVENGGQRDCVQSGLGSGPDFSQAASGPRGRSNEGLLTSGRQGGKGELLLQRVKHVFSFPSTPVPGATPVAAHESKESTTKDVGEDVVHPWAAPATFPQALLSVSVIELLLLRVAQHLVGKTDFFKLLRDGEKGGDLMSRIQTRHCCWR